MTNTGTSKKAGDQIKKDVSEAARQVQADAARATDQVKSDASAAAEEIKADAAGAIGDAKRDLGAEVEHDFHEIGREAGRQFEGAMREARNVADEQKDRFAGRIGGVADALDKVGGELESDNAAVAGYAHAAAEKAREVTRVIENSTIEEILARAEDFGRRQPLALVGAAALAGFAASRFLTASAHRARGPGGR